MVKWEAQGSTMGPGMRPYVYRQFPMMMHHASNPTTIDDQQVAMDENDERSLRSRGFRSTPLEALEAHNAQALEYAKLSAELEHEKHFKLSQAAAAEVTAAQNETSGHMPTMPIAPLPPKSGLAAWAQKKEK